MLAICLNCRALKFVRIIFIISKEFIPFLNALLIRRRFGDCSKHFPFVFSFVWLYLYDSPLDNAGPFEVVVFAGAYRFISLCVELVVLFRILRPFVLSFECPGSFHDSFCYFVRDFDCFGFGAGLLKIVIILLFVRCRDCNRSGRS